MTASPPKGPLVLYVDDERANRIVLEQSMKLEFNILVAESGEKALELLNAHEVAVVITDMRMPGMQGDELLRIVKERHPQIVRMVMTAHQDVGPILRAINEGLVARYIIKPWERPELVQVLRWACEAWTFGRDSAALHRRLMETERLATLGSIAGLLVHDLRQPLMSQLANIEVLQDFALDAPTLTRAIEGTEMDAETRERLLHFVKDLTPTLDDLKEATLHLSNLITGLRDLSRPRVDTGNAIPAIDPLPIVRHAMAVCQELTMKSRSSIGYDGPQNLPHVRMSSTELMQVLINVVSNGAQAVAARGVPNGKVEIHAREQGGMLELQIQDNGVGMPPDVLSRAGTPFFTTRAEGTGLGIAQCQRLVGTAGGRFLIESEQGKGTTVTIVLPTAA
jgi:two-component system NtrC family sensor kinase